MSVTLRKLELQDLDAIERIERESYPTPWSRSMFAGELAKGPSVGILGLDQEAIRLLSIAGLSDAYLYIRKPAELSDGQRYRFRLAKLIEENADVWVADEFGAVLDRVTAKIVAWNLAKTARALGKTLIVATTHTDLVEELAPSLKITSTRRPGCVDSCWSPLTMTS